MSSIAGFLLFAALVYAIYLIMESQRRGEIDEFERMAALLDMRYFPNGNGEIRSVIEKAMPPPEGFTSHLEDVLVGHRGGEPMALATLVEEPDAERGNVRRQTVFCAKLTGFNFPEFEVRPSRLFDNLFSKCRVELPTQIAKSYRLGVEESATLPTELVQSLTSYLKDRKKNHLVWRGGYFSYAVVGYQADIGVLDSFLQGVLDALDQIRPLAPDSCFVASDESEAIEEREGDDFTGRPIEDGGAPQESDQEMPAALLGPHPGFKPMPNVNIPGSTWFYRLCASFEKLFRNRLIVNIDPSRSFQPGPEDEFLGHCIREAEELGLAPQFACPSRRYAIRALGWLSGNRTILVVAWEGKVWGKSFRMVEALSCYDGDQFLQTASQPVDYVRLPGVQSLVMLDAELAEILAAHISEGNRSYDCVADEFDAAIDARALVDIWRSRVQSLVEEGCAYWPRFVREEEYRLTWRGVWRVARRRKKSASSWQLWVRSTEF